ncbi:MAG: acyltransferase [Treponema sp.]|jgi:peptidoglycan/LPS O-acetylase OafA/YrhL|nr:acyltransferase [Treponema sp.]
MRNNNQSNYFHRIDLYRFIFTIFVVILHFECFYPTKPKEYIFSLYRSVDFFFVLSGFLLYRTFKTKRYTTSLDYVISKVKKFMPLNVIIILLSSLCAVLMPITGIKSLFSMATSFIINFFSSIANLLFLQLFIPVLEKFIPSRFEGLPLWYISALLVSSFLWFQILLHLQKKNGENSKNYAWGLVSAIFIFAFLIQQYEKLDLALDIVPIFNVPAGFLRGFAEMGLGIFCANYKFELKNKKIINFLKIFLPLILFVLIFYAKYTVIDFAFVFVICIVLIFEFSLEEEVSSIKQKIYKTAGNFSLSIYFTHAFVIFFEYTSLLRIYSTFRENFLLDIAIRIILIVSSSLIVYGLSKPVSKMLYKLYSCIKLIGENNTK